MAVLVMAEAPRGAVKPRLEGMLGRAGCERLQRALTARPLRWGAEEGDAVYVAYAPEDAEAEVAALAPEGATLFAQRGAHRGERLADAFRRASEGPGGPVMVVGTGQPGLSAAHAGAAADDLRSGIDVTLGPATAGGYYLLAARRYDPALFAIDPDAWGGPEVMNLTLRSVLDAGLSIGWLRSERDLDAPADAPPRPPPPRPPADTREALEP